MNRLTEKAAYLKGYLEGSDFDLTSKEGKALSAMTDLLSELCAAVEAARQEQQELKETVEALDISMDSVCEELYGDEYDDEDDDCCCDDEAVYEIVCDGCGETFYLEEDDVLAGSYTCPKCGKTLEFEFLEDEDDCDCGCSHDAEE